MVLQNVHDVTFNKYGMVIEGYDFNEIIEVLEKNTEKPEAGVIYVASENILEALPVFGEMQDRLFGGLPIQAGFCNGSNTLLNSLEYHRGSEALIAADDIILLLAQKQDIVNCTIDTSKVEAFFVPKGTGVLYYETTLHYAPAKVSGSFRTVIVLPRTTNTVIPKIEPLTMEDKTLFARNKWLLAHPDSPEAKDGAFAGLTGKNICVRELEK